MDGAIKVVEYLGSTGAGVVRFYRTIRYALSILLKEELPGGMGRGGPAHNSEGKEETNWDGFEQIEEKETRWQRQQSVEGGGRTERSAEWDARLSGSPLSTARM